MFMRITKCWWLGLVALLAWAGEAAAQDFRGQDLAGTVFEDFDFSGVDFSDSDLTEALFVRCDLSGANFSDANLSFALFADSNLQGATLTGSQAEVGPAFVGSDLRDAVAAPVQWRQAIIRVSDCSGIDFTASGLIDLRIEDSVCQDANFFLIDGAASVYPGSDLTRARFEQAIVVDADFAGTNLTQANFVNADIQGASFLSAVTDGIQF